MTRIFPVTRIFHCELLVTSLPGPPQLNSPLHLPPPSQCSPRYCRWSSLNTSSSSPALPPCCSSSSCAPRWPPGRPSGCWRRSQSVSVEQECHPCCCTFCPPLPCPPVDSKSPVTLCDSFPVPSCGPCPILSPASPPLSSSRRAQHADDAQHFPHGGAWGGQCDAWYPPSS